MYIKKEIKEFLEKMPKETKLNKEWKKFINKTMEPFNILIEHGKEEYECTNCGKYSYGRLLSDRNNRYYEICRFCGKKFQIRKSNLRNYNFEYSVAIIDNINNKIVIRYYAVRRIYNYMIRRFDTKIDEFARIIPEYDIVLLNNRCPYGRRVYCDDKVTKWRVFGGNYYYNTEYNAIYLKDIDYKKIGTSYQYIPLGEAINHLKEVRYNDLRRVFELSKYKSFELLLKAGLYNLALKCPQKFNEEGSFEKRFGVKKSFYEFMKKHDITEEELEVLKIIKRPNIEIIRRLLRIAFSRVDDLKRASKYINLIKLEEYSKSQEMFSIQSYLDYIENLEKIGIPLTKKKLLPKDFSKAHDLSVKKAKIVENELLNKNIQQRYRELERNKFQGDKLFIRPAKTLKDMKDEANQQDNCVYSNYSEKYAKGETDIYFLRKLKNPEKSLVTVEVSKGKIRQKYQKRNTTINKEQKEFLNFWEQNVLNVGIKGRR